VQQYSKQTLHEDELPYFICGKEQLFITENGSKIAPAICYESLLMPHAEHAYRSGSNIYIASVAKSKAGVEKAFKHFPEIAAKFEMIVLMANSTGPSDNFESAGKTSIWNSKGQLVGQLDDNSEGILIIDTATENVIKEILK
jgi:predicted amidohydrolase